MGNDTKSKEAKKYIFLMMCLLFVIVCILIIIAIIILRPPADAVDDTQATATQEPESTPIPTIILVPEVTDTETVEVSIIPEISPTIEIELDVVWINLSYLIIRGYPDFSYDKIGHIPYGERVTGTIDGLWMFVSYDGVEGYIYVGKVHDTDRPCVVYSESDLQPLD